MPTFQFRSARWLLAWLVSSAAIGIVVVRVDIADRREAFQAKSRTAHRLLSQRASQHDAILGMLALLDPGSSGDTRSSQLQALYPQVLQVWRRPTNAAWPDAAIARAEALSSSAARPALVAVDVAARHYDLVLAGSPASFALRIELDRWVPWSEWPFDRAGPVRAELVLDRDTLPLQPGIAASGWHGGVTPGFVFHKALDTPSQPFVLRVQRATGPADWPWASLLALSVVLALVLSAVAAVMSQRAGRRRAEQLLRLGRTSRLNALGELAAGMAHELNQPLTAVIASTQAARRLLDDEPLPQETLREALGHATDQARRAADVVARLRRLVDRPGGTEKMQAVPLGEAARSALALLQPELQRLAVRPMVDDASVFVRADPVVLEQILHNLLNNALQALATVPAAQRTLQLSISAQQRLGILRLRDSGPGLAPQVLDHLFEPFMTTRADGLGLGLSLCHSLAMAMNGTLSAQNIQPHGAEFRLELPLAEKA